ncbi:MAG TPA: HGGxSTG domain-containing protein [Aestuariivirgaceae bacterium]
MPGTHPRNWRPMLQSLRCGAKTRKGGCCRAPAVRGKKRCRMHGGAKGSGAPRGNSNAFKHGVFTKEAIKRRVLLRKLIREGQKLLKQLRR